MRYKKLTPAKDMEWIQPVMKGYYMGCCDCGLVHRLDFRIAEGVRKGRKIERIQFRATRSRNYTAMLRRKQKPASKAKEE